MLICVHPGQHEVSANATDHHHGFTNSNPLVPPPVTPPSLCVVDYPLFLVA